MSRKAIFLDIDGTLVNDRGLVPDSARVAVQRARANGWADGERCAASDSGGAPLPAAIVGP